MPRGWRIFAVMLIVAVSAGGTSWWLGSRVVSSQEAAARAQPPEPSLITAPVELRELREVLVISGRVSGGEEIEVMAEPAVPVARVIVTSSAPPPGSEVDAGELLVEVSGRPVFLLAGQVPMYRNLAAGDEGADVATLQEALRALGFDGWDAAGQFGAGTEAAVRRFYESYGYQPVTEPADAHRPGGEQAGEQLGEQAEQREQLVVPAAEIVFVASLPTVVTAVHATAGQQPAGPVLTLSSGDVTVTAPVTGAEREILATGTSVSVATAAGDGFDGVVAGVRPADDPAAGPGGGDVLVVEGADRIDPALLGQEVRITAVLASTDEPVLAVPLAAIWSTADGSTYVSVPGDDDQQLHLPVVAGVSAQGFVELVTVDGELVEGDPVVVGQGGVS